MAEEEVTSTEPVEASPPPADDSAPIAEPEKAEEAPAEPQTPEPEPEQDHISKALDEAFAKQFPETEAPVEDDKVTLTKSELAEQIRRERQSADNRARSEADTQARDREEKARQDYARRQDLHRQIDVLAKTSLDDNGNLKPDFADSVLAGHEGLVYQRASAEAASQQDQVLISAVRGLDFMQEAKPEDWEPMQKAAGSRVEEVGQLLQVVYNRGRSVEKAAMETEIEKRSNAIAKVKAEAMKNETLAALRANQPNGELPAGTAPKGRISDAEFATHRNDPIGSDGKSDWFRANEERIDAQLRATNK